MSLQIYKSKLPQCDILWCIHSRGHEQQLTVVALKIDDALSCVTRHDDVTGVEIEEIFDAGGREPYRAYSATSSKIRLVQTFFDVLLNLAEIA